LGFGLELSKILDVMGRLLASSPRELRERVLLGLERALVRGDLAMLYHYVSMLSRDYYGVDLPYSFDYYYKRYPGARRIQLPRPLERLGVDVLECIRSRRSRRRYSREPLKLSEVATILFHTVGVTGRAWWGGPKRVYPSAGALQPVEAYLVASRVEGLEAGIYHYNPGEHVLEEVKAGDYGSLLADIALGQDHVGEASANIVLTIVYRRTASKYGLRAYRYAHLDVGFAAQNIYLVVEALNLATVAVGAFYDEELCKLLDVDCEEEIPALIFPIGRRS